MASSQDEVRISSESSSKAMKLLGLSKLPPDASRSEHLTLIRQHRSARKERAKSNSPSSLKRGDSGSRLGSYSGAGGASSRSITSSADGRRGGGGHEQYPDEDVGCGSDSEDEGEGIMPHPHQRQNSEWLDMRESPLKLSPSDLDDRFLQAITDLMNQFPEPPNTGSITELNSPATAAFGRRGLHMPNMPRPSSQRRGPGGASLEASGDVPLSRQNPIYQQQIESRRGGGGVRELDSPVRIRYNKPEEQFSL